MNEEKNATVRSEEVRQKITKGLKAFLRDEIIVDLGEVFDELEKSILEYRYDRTSPLCLTYPQHHNSD